MKRNVVFSVDQSLSCEYHVAKNIFSCKCENLRSHVERRDIYFVTCHFISFIVLFIFVL